MGATIATLNNRVTTDVAQVFTCRGANSLSITITGASIFLSFARRENDVIGGFGPEEFTLPQLLDISGEPIDAVAFRSGAAGVPAQITIVATR